MRSKTKERLMDVVLILVFMAIIAGSAYFIIKVMTHWKVKGLG